MWWCICREGMVAKRFYREGFTMEFYETLIKEELAPAVLRLKYEDPPILCTKYLQDAVAGRQVHEHIYPALASVFGDSGFFEHAPRSCTFYTGETKLINCRRKDTGLE
jgi:hypothetical protein